MKKHLIKLTCGVTLLSVAAQAQYTAIYDPLSLPDYGTYVTGVSGNNVVGWYTGSDGNGNNGTFGFLYNGSTYTPLSMPGYGNAFALGVGGNKVVGYYYDNGGEEQGFYYNGSTYTTISPYSYGSHWTQCSGIYGNIVLVNQSDYYGRSHGFLYNTDSKDSIGIGTPGVSSYFYGIYENSIVGTYSDSQFGRHAFLYDGSSFTELMGPSGALPGSTVPTGISGNNIVGNFQISDGTSHSFLYNNGNYTIIDSLMGIYYGEVYGIDGNTISGGNGGGFINTIAPTPEPSTLALTAVGGLGGLLFFRRRK